MPAYIVVSHNVHARSLSAESTIQVNVYPAKNLSSGDWVKMSWRYIDNPSIYDWIGVYSPPIDDIYLINPTKQAPIKVKVSLQMHQLYRY